MSDLPLDLRHAIRALRPAWTRWMRPGTSSRDGRRVAPGRPPLPSQGAEPTAVSTGRLDAALLVMSVAVGLALVLLATAVFIRIVGG